MGEHVWAEIQMVWTAAGREAVAYSEQGGRLGAGEILTMLNEHAALKRDNRAFREFLGEDGLIEMAVFARIEEQEDE